MISLTLEYSGTEKFLADWGYTDPVLKLNTTLDGASTFTVRAPGNDPAGAEDIPYWGVVKIRMGRTFSGSFSGGSIIFVGRRTDYNRTASPSNAGTTRVFSDPWFDLTQIIFQHYWKQWNGSALVDFYFSRLNLFQDISAGPGVPWTYLTTYGQILQILTYAAGAGANLQTGTIDPTWTVPSFGVKAISCAEALQLCCRPMADVTKYFDYTTTPPKLHIRQRPNLSAQTLPYAGTSGPRAHQSSQIKSREDLVPPCVSIQYQETSTVDEKTYNFFTVDTYPAMADPAQMGALVVPIDLRGSAKTTVKGQVTAVACDPTTTAFWTRHKKELADSLITDLAIVNTAINDASLQCITIKDASGTNVRLSDYPNEQTAGGDIASWMKSGSTQITGKQVTITGWLKYKQNDPNPAAAVQPLHEITGKQVSVNVKLTNSAAGTIKYSALKTYTAGDPAITGLAQNTYNSLSQLQWEGEHIIVDAELAGGLVDVSKNLNLSGGATAWATMAAALAGVTVEFTTGTQTVDFGPHKHLSADQFVEYLLMWRYRQVYDNPSVRSDGQTAPSTDVQMPEDPHVDDTTHGKPNANQYTFGAFQDPVSSVAQPDAQINLDAKLLAKYTPTGGSPQAGLMASLPANQRVLQPRKLLACINGNLMYVVAIAGPTQTA